MKGQRALRQTAAARVGRRRLTRGFTLIELMVVVLIIALLAVIALPGMSQARDDRLAWDYARQFQNIVHGARARAAGRGAAQLVLFGPGPAGRGFARQFEALDGVPGGVGPPGPNPISSCKAVGQWTNAEADPPGTNNNTARYVDWLDLNSAGINTNMDVRSTFILSTVPVTFLAICITPTGTTYVGGGGSAAAADVQMQSTPAFNDVAEIDVQRNRGGAPNGLKRRIIIAGSAAPRLKSE